MKSLQGVILIVVLLFLQILAVMSLFAIKLVWMETKANENILHKHDIYHLAEQALSQIETNIAQNILNCSIKTVSTSELMTRSLSWWQTVACKGFISPFKFYYVIEFLGEDACALIKISPLAIANYFRITLMSIDKEIKIALQSTIIKPNYTELICTGKTHFVTLGKQMQREINISKL